MWRRLWFPALALGLGLSAQVAAPTLPAPSVPAQGNSVLTGRIMQRLTDDPILRHITITASVGENGVVSLNGVVPTPALEQRAVDAVQTVPGVKSVTSRILVNRDPFATPAPAAATAAPPPVNANPPAPAAALEPQVLLADALAKFPALARVSSRVYDDEVMLIGTVTKSQARAQAETIAKQIVPKLPITNIIWVDPHPLAPPPLFPANLYGASAHR